MKRRKHSCSTEEASKTRRKLTTSNAAVSEGCHDEGPPTVSVAIPGSILDNTQNAEMRSYLVGQVARAMVIYNVHEVVVFDEHPASSSSFSATGKDQHHRHGDPNLFMRKLLRYLETPQYLRKHLFPLDPDLKYAGVLNPLDCPHHMRQDDLCPYREGVVVEDKQGVLRSPAHSLVDCGLDHDVLVDGELPPATRVTVHMDYNCIAGLKGQVVSPLAPWIEGGLYWGYKVRLAPSFGAVFTESPFKEGYDLTIGTSERGTAIDHLHQLPAFRHVLIVLGGVKGLEYSLSCADELQVEDVSLLFHHYLNLCPEQGSRTIRTEEALLVVLSTLRPRLLEAQQPAPTTRR